MVGTDSTISNGRTYEEHELRSLRSRESTMQPSYPDRQYVEGAQTDGEDEPLVSSNEDTFRLPVKGKWQRWWVFIFKFFH